MDLEDLLAKTKQEILDYLHFGGGLPQRIGIGLPLYIEVEGVRIPVEVEQREDYYGSITTEKK